MGHLIQVTRWYLGDIYSSGVWDIQKDKQRLNLHLLKENMGSLQKQDLTPLVPSILVAGGLHNEEGVYVLYSCACVDSDMCKYVCVETGREEY